MGASTSVLSEEEKKNYIEALLHGDVQGIAAELTQELNMLKSGNLTDEEVQAKIVDRLKKQHAHISSKVAAHLAEVPEPPPVSSKTAGIAAAATSSEKASDPEPPTKEPESFPEIVAKVIEEKMVKRSMTYMVCVDGSQLGDMAFHCALNMRRKKDNLILFHSYVPDAEREPQYQRDHIRMKYEPELIGNMMPERYRIAFVERLPGETAKDSIAKIIQKCRRPLSPSTKSLLGSYKPDFLVMGFSGRRSESEQRPFLGSKADKALRTVHIPIIICKTPCPPIEAVRTFVLAVDASDVSKRGLDVLMTLLRPRDNLTVLHLTNPNPDHVAASNAEKMQTYFEDELKRYGPVDSHFETYVCDPTKSIADNLVDHINYDVAPDFLVLAPRAQETITSITEQVILKSKSSVILCKA